MAKSSAVIAYRLVLRLYPPSFRRRFGAEMAQTFLDHRADLAARGGHTGLRFWAALLADEAGNLVRQHGAAFAASVPRPTRGRIVLAALLFPPLFGAFLLATANLTAAVPHPALSGLAVLLGMGVLIAVPALLAAAASYLLASAMASGAARLRGRA